MTPPPPQHCSDHQQDDEKDEHVHHATFDPDEPGLGMAVVGWTPMWEIADQNRFAARSAAVSA